MSMTAGETRESYMLHFGLFAKKLESYLLDNGISCHEADLIIEETSAAYIARFGGGGPGFLRFVRRRQPASVFVDSACEAVKRHIPEAQNTFGSRQSLSSCLR